ncbi:Uncharacterised protein [Mycobacteroides abscessus subsp. abscessus]|nr:Uncharacterised protein [Mycobacteroides abscessus subsp. abscessus]
MQGIVTGPLRHDRHRPGIIDEHLHGERTGSDHVLRQGGPGIDERQLLGLAPGRGVGPDQCGQIGAGHSVEHQDAAFHPSTRAQHRRPDPGQRDPVCPAVGCVDPGYQHRDTERTGSVEKGTRGQLENVVRQHLRHFCLPNPAGAVEERHVDFHLPGHSHRDRGVLGELVDRQRGRGRTPLRHTAHPVDTQLDVRRTNEQAFAVLAGPHPDLRIADRGREFEPGGVRGQGRAAGDDAGGGRETVALG